LFLNLKEENLPKGIEKTMNYLWWENGHILSLLYAGTNSLKSDILMYIIN